MSATVLKMSEKALEAAVVELADHLGWLSFHPFYSQRSTPGFPDRTFVRNGRLLFVEFKSDEGRLSRAQELWIEELCKVEVASLQRSLDGACRPNVEVHVWRPDQWRDGTVEGVLR